MIHFEKFVIHNTTNNRFHNFTQQVIMDSSTFRKIIKWLNSDLIKYLLTWKNLLEHNLTLVAEMKGELEQKLFDFPKILITISQVWSRNTTLTWFCHCYAPNAWTSIFQLKCVLESFSELPTLFDRHRGVSTRINRTHVVFPRKI